MRKDKGPEYWASAKCAICGASVVGCLMRAHEARHVRDGDRAPELPDARQRPLFGPAPAYTLKLHRPAPADECCPDCGYPPASGHPADCRYWRAPARVTLRRTPMLPNVYHPGRRCSCRDCLGVFVELAPNAGEGEI